MTIPEAGEPDPHADASPIWGTWEELLLAFAVNRHGTAAWDSIAAELQKRTLDRGLSLTAQNCRIKYLDLKRRYIAGNEDFEDDGKHNVEETVPLLEELRKLRVAELRREVQRYDLNIESLELKMKWMEEERDTKDARESDLEKEGNQEREYCPPGSAAGEPVTVAELEKDQLSVNESNSTDPLADKSRTDEKESKPDREGNDETSHDRASQKGDESTRPDSAETDRKSVREDSCNGSSNSIEVPDRKAKAEPVSVSAGIVESHGESGNGGGEEAATKENSDVQSSASKSRKEMGNDKVVRENTWADEREHEDQSRAVQNFSADSQPLMDFLLAIRSHKLGSILERRLLSQESSEYNNMILQHVDLETIEAKLKEGFYSSSANKFFRDLLLLVNNALVFFPGCSSEFNAATEIRSIVSKEMWQRNAKSESSNGKQASLQSLSVPRKEEAEPSTSLNLKPRISGPLFVCRKRSSIIAKASGALDKKRDRSLVLTGEKEEEKTQILKAEDEPKITKKRSRERFSSITANSKKNAKTTSKNSSVESGKQQGKGELGSSSNQTEENKLTQIQPVPESKKRGAAMFLNRMNQSSSPTNNGALLDALKNTPLTSDSNANKGGSESNKNKNTNTKQRGVKKEPRVRRSLETKQVKDKAPSPVKRNVGRPPKRGTVAAPPPPPQPSLGKRGRERGGEVESLSSSKQPRKRSRKL